MYGRQGENEITESAQPPGTGGDVAGATSAPVIRTNMEASRIRIADFIMMIDADEDEDDGYFC